MSPTQARVSASREEAWGKSSRTQGVGTEPHKGGSEEGPCSPSAPTAAATAPASYQRALLSPLSGSCAPSEQALGLVSCLLPFYTLIA